MRNYPWSAESSAILQETGVFDTVTPEAIAMIEESREVKSRSADGADDQAVEQER